jgi:urease accessory protein
LTARVHEVLAAGAWDARAAADVASLDFDARHRRRILLTTQGGREILLDLPQARRLCDGDGLVLQDGVVCVRAACEAVMDIHASAQALVRIAWHLGNRHLPVQILQSALRIRADHVVGGMVAGLGGHVQALHAPFQPEGGAYAGAHHDHGQHGQHPGQDHGDAGHGA